MSYPIARANSNTGVLSVFTQGQTKRKHLLPRSPHICVASASFEEFCNVLEQKQPTSQAINRHPASAKPQTFHLNLSQLNHRQTSDRILPAFLSNHPILCR